MQIRLKDGCEELLLPLTLSRLSFLDRAAAVGCPKFLIHEMWHETVHGNESKFIERTLCSVDDGMDRASVSLGSTYVVGVDE